MQSINKSINSFVIFLQLFQPTKESFFLQFLNNKDKTHNNLTNTILQASLMYKQIEKNNELLSLEISYFN